MTIKEALDKLTEIMRLIQYANKSADEIVLMLHNFMLLVGQALVQRDEAETLLKQVSNQLWISHIKGDLDCPACNSLVPIDFWVGSKGISGDPLVSQTKEDLIEKLEFPPITAQDLTACPIPDYMPEL